MLSQLRRGLAVTNLESKIFLLVNKYQWRRKISINSVTLKLFKMTKDKRIMLQLFISDAQATGMIYPFFMLEKVLKNKF